MHLPVTAVIILVYSSSVLGQFNMFGQDKIPGCQYPSPTWSSYVYTIDADDTPSHHNFTFTIKTPWTHYYSAELISALPGAGLKLTPSPSGTKPLQICNWKIVTHVEKDGVKRGEVTYKDLSVGDPKLYRPPPKDTVDKIVGLLASKVPTRDFTLEVLQIVVPILGTALFIAACYSIARLRLRKGKRDTDSMSVELASIKGDTTSLPAAMSASEPPTSFPHLGWKGKRGPVSELPALAFYKQSSQSGSSDLFKSNDYYDSTSNKSF